MKHAAIALVMLLGSCGPGAPAPKPVPRPQPTPETQPAAVVVPPEPTPVAAPEPPPPPPPPPDRIVRLLVVSAETSGSMANGEDWDAKGAVAATGTPAPLARYLEQHPELAETAATVGVPVDDDKLVDAAGKSPAADPMVIVEIGGTVFRTPARPRQFNAVWDFPITFLYGRAGERAGVPIGAMARFQVVDFDGPQAFDGIGSTLVPVDQLIAGNLHTLGPFGSVHKLVVVATTEPVPAAPPGPRVARLAVTSNARWTDTGIDLIAGQRVEIDAADEVCSSGSSLDHCSGPEGQRKPSSYNLPGFAKIGHAALIGAIGDVRFPVGRSRTFTAASSGRLLLGVNDTKTSDNRGSYAVRVTIHALP